MSVLNLENAKWLIATLAIPAALGLVAHQYQQSQAERQIADAGHGGEEHGIGKAVLADPQLGGPAGRTGVRSAHFISTIQACRSLGQTSAAAAGSQGAKPLPRRGRVDKMA